MASPANAPITVKEAVQVRPSPVSAVTPPLVASMVAHYPITAPHAVHGNWRHGLRKGSAAFSGAARRPYEVLRVASDCHRTSAIFVRGPVAYPGPLLRDRDNESATGTASSRQGGRRLQLRAQCMSPKPPGTSLHELTAALTSKPWLDDFGSNGTGDGWAARVEPRVQRYVE
jgi:hypothetical protein